MSVGIEAINAYGGQIFIDVKTLFEARNLDLSRFDNLMMVRKSVGLPCEDPVTNGVNAAKPIIDALSQHEKNNIELIITATESGLDFGKSLSTYIHDYLGLSRRCRLFEIKQACYGGTAALQMAASYIAANSSSNAKALVVATDVARAAAKRTYAEPSQGIAAVAMLVGQTPYILELDMGANGFHSYEVMDTCRPEAEIETGDPDLSLLSYLDCLDASFKAYKERVDGVDLKETFSYLAFHTPFAGMVKGAHRKLLRQNMPGITADFIESDFKQRVLPSLKYCTEVGNVYSASVYLALCGLIDHAQLTRPERVGLFSYGSGCSSEFYSGVITPQSKEQLGKFKIKERLRDRYSLSMQEYDDILDVNMTWLFGVKDKIVDLSEFSKIYAERVEGKGLLTLKSVENYHRKYVWS